MIKALRLIIVLVVIMSSCKTNWHGSQQQIPIGDNSQNSLDWDGVYRGLLPCADCEGILTELEIRSDLTYELSTQYQGATDEIFKEKGVLKWNDAGSKITLIREGNEVSRQYQVGENVLFSLDGDGNRITGDLAEMFILRKKGYDYSITEKYWKLQTLNGEPISYKENQSTEAFFILKDHSKKVNGNTGCNGMRGSYTLEGENQIKFSQMLTTRMACMDVPYEGEYLQVLERTDHYSLIGDTLTLKSEDKPLATFVNVWFQ